jgi:hypothetical protein
MGNLNPNCDGDKCRHHGVVRVYPLGAGGNLILCADCWRHENAYRRARGVETGESDNWPQEDWNAAELYRTGE